MISSLISRPQLIGNHKPKAHVPEEHAFDNPQGEYAACIYQFQYQRRNKEHDLFLMIRIVIIYVLSPIAQFVLYFKRGVVCVVLFMSHLLAKDD